MFEFIQETFRGVFPQDVLDLICSLEDLIKASDVSKTKTLIHAQNPDEKTKREYAFLLLYIYDSCSEEERSKVMPELRYLFLYTKFLSEVLEISETEIYFILLTSGLRSSVNAIIYSKSTPSWDFSVLFLPSQHDKTTPSGSTYFYKMLRNKETRHYLTKQLLGHEKDNVFLENGELIPELLRISPEGICPLHCYLVSTDEEDYAMLKNLLVAAKSMKTLTEDPRFLDIIFRPHADALILPWLLMSSDKEQLSNEFITEKNAKIIADNPDYVYILIASIPTTATIPTKIEWLLKTPVGRKLVVYQSIQTIALNDPNLIPLLLGKIPGKAPLLYSFLQDGMMNSFLGNAEFKDKLLADPEFEDALCYCPDEDETTSTLHLLMKRDAIPLLNTLLLHSNFKERLIDLLLKCYPNSTPKIYDLAVSNKDALKTLLSYPGFKEQLMAHPNFIPQLLEARADNMSVLYLLIGDDYNPVLLLDILNNETTKRQLLDNSRFVPILLQKNASQNSSILTNLFICENSTSTVEKILEPSVCDALLTHPDLIPRLISHERALEWVLSNACSKAPRLRQFVCDPRFQEGLSKNEQFIPILLARNPAYMPPLQYLIFLGTDSLLTTNKDFTNQLISNVNFFPALFFRPPKIEPKFTDGSCFYEMVTYSLSKNHVFLHTVLSSSCFKAWVEDSNHLESFILTLFAVPTKSMSTAYANLVEKDTTKKLIKLLFDIKPARRAIFAHLSIPEEGESLALSLLRCQEGYDLLKTLHQTNHTAALNQASFKSLFKSHVIQQLIHLQRINPAWFLYIALHGDNPCEDVAFILGQSVIFPWSPNISGRYPHHIIEILNIAETEKNYLKDLIHSGSLKYKKEKAYFLLSSRPEISGPPVPMSVSEEPEGPDGKKRLRGDPAVDGKEPSEQPGQPDEIATMSACLQTLKMDKEHITEQALYSLLEQCVTWILSQELLCSYHHMFQSLLNNESFRSQPDFIAVLELLTSLIVAMKIRIDANDIPPVDSRWKLTNCTTAVLDTLRNILSTFQGKSLIECYLEEVVRSQVKNYNKLFGVASNLEIHAPMFPIRAVSTHSIVLPHYDPNILLWSPHQCLWVMQSIAESNLEARSWLYDEWLGALVSLVPDTITSQSTCIDVGNLAVDSPWRLCLQLLNNTKLFEIEFDISTFFNLLGLTIDEETLLCEVTDKEKTKALFLQTINAKFNTWYEQQALPQKKIIHLYSELLWSYLIGAQNEWQDQLLQRLPHAIDAGALIKHSITQHKDQLHKLKIAQLLKRIPGYPVSFLSILLSNPFYAAWLFAYRINVTRTTTEEIILTFSPTEDLAGIKERFDEKDNQTDFLNALEWAFTQPGTLFFWLYFFSQSKLHESLYAAITKFILSSTRNDLFGYDSLLPVLYDMQRSNLVNDEEKTLVISFLELRAEEMLKIKATEPYWDIICTLYENDEDLFKTIKQHQEKNPWLQPSPRVRAYLDRQRRHSLSFFDRATSDNANSSSIESHVLNP